MRIRILLIVLTAGFFTAVTAQDTTSLYQQVLDRFLQYLDKSQIPTGILYDRVAKIAELDTLSDVVNANTNPAIKTSSLHFLQAWQELYHASYNRSAMLKPQWLDALITEKGINNIVPVGVLNYQFNIFDPAAMDDNLIYQTPDTMLHDVPGRSRLPYITKDIFLASPLLYNIKAGSVTFTLSSNMVLQNRSVTLTSISIDFGGGQTINLNPGGSATLQLQSGVKTLTSTANFSNGTQKKINSIIEM
jgi:hypothetical protein